jgi:hypothetical protein
LLRRRPIFCSALVVVAFLLFASQPNRAYDNIMLTDVPDYSWYAGCFGTASGNLMGYWDRHGFPDFYTGPTAGGVAPLTSDGPNVGIRSMWASRAGFDGRPASQYGHIDDYWNFYLDDQTYSYESTAPDPYVTAGRSEHKADCIGDFIGLSQNKWTNLNGECSGNIDAFSFVFWDSSGDKRTNFVPPPQGGRPVADIPSGLRAWTEYRGSEAEVFSQLVNFNPNVPTGHGFTFADLKAEIDAGYPVLLYLQNYNQLYRYLAGPPLMPYGNPDMHGMLAYGYYIADSGNQYVRYKDSWGGSGNNRFALWGPQQWEASLPVRGIIGYHPLPQITQVQPLPHNTLAVQWSGPSSVLSNIVSQTSTPLHLYVLEKATTLNPPNFEAAAAPTTKLNVTLTNCCGPQTVFFRLKLLPPGSTNAP